MAISFLKQRYQMDCGPTCLYMLCKNWGRPISIEKLRELTEIGKEGVNLLGISNAAESIGLKTLALQLSFEKLINEAPLPAILHWGKNHFVIINKVIKRGIFGNKNPRIQIVDPARGIYDLSKNDFIRKWCSSRDENNTPVGIALIIEPTQTFYSKNFDQSYDEIKKVNFSIFTGYLIPYKKQFLQLVLGMLMGSILQLILPFLTQSIVDVGVNSSSISFVTLILFAQLALFAGRLVVEFIRSWILFHISSRINIAILTDFFIKLMKLPVSYFDSKKTGDILQRMNDHQRIRSFLTGNSLSAVFSLFNLIVFAGVLLSYDTQIFLIFLSASVLYVIWIILFLKLRKQLDYQQFEISAAEQSRSIQMIQGMQEIKLNNCEKQQRWKWEFLQAALFKVGIKNLKINQWQQTGAFLINEGKNIIITYLAATAVINGNITLGSMLAIQYIIGQLNSPIEQMIGFVQSWQLAKISIDRLNEIHAMEDEESVTQNDSNIEKLSKQIPIDKTIRFANISFKYPGAGNLNVLENINLTIPNGKVTAIVGSSGSGKTTLLKLILKFYNPTNGDIFISKSEEGKGQLLKNISHSAWRKQCGVVMQESFIFSDTIAKNIAVGEDHPDKQKLQNACEIANITSFIEGLPLGYNTKIGAEGNGISAGQKQRILIARAVYKDPEIILFDEATNALDANNERVIIKQLQTFFKGKTVIIVAHRLSTVKFADQIIVMENGQIKESGTHDNLTFKQGAYYDLIKNQLELGN